MKKKGEKMKFFRRKEDEEERRRLQGLVQTDPSIHANSNVYKDLSAKADAMSKVEKDTPVGDGWKVKDNYFDKKSNFKGVLYEKDGQYAFAFAGTERPTLKSLGGWKDWGANLKMGLTGDSAQNKRAKAFAEKMKETYGLNSENTVVLGHSEGGFEATNVGLNNGFKTYTFNGYGVHKSKLAEGVDTSKVINYRDPHDPVSKIHANVGQTYIVPGTQNKFMARTPFGSIQSHSIDNMGDVTKAVSPKKFKEDYYWFLDKISDAEITGEDVGLMDSNTFALYEPEIDERLRRRQIFPSAFLAERGVPYIAGINGSRGYYRRFG